MRLANPEKKNQIEKRSYQEEHYPAAEMMSRHHDQTRDPQEDDQNELKCAPCCLQYRPPKKNSQTFRPSFPHGAKGAIHPSSHNTSTITKPNSMT
jgi:hypothetical protein